MVEDEIIQALAQLRDFEDSGTHPYRQLIAEKVRTVNPAELTAKELFRTLAMARIRRTGPVSDAKARCQFFISVPAADCPQVKLGQDGGLEQSYKYGRETGHLSIEDTRVVPLTSSELPSNSLKLIQTALPNVWEGMQVAPSVGTAAN